MTLNRETGNIGERLAAEFLERQGYSVLERQYRFERAEVDLICFDPGANVADGEIVFVEVKARRTRAFGRPEDAVTISKQKQIAKAAAAYLYESKLEGAACRFDVIALDKAGDDPGIRHFKHAFEDPGP